MCGRSSVVSIPGAAAHTYGMALTKPFALNAGTASRDKFPRAVLPRTFDYGFATGLMVKDVRLYVDEAKALGLPTHIADAVATLWENTLIEEGPASDSPRSSSRSRKPRASSWEGIRGES